MLGDNKLQLNRETVIAAIQLYLDSQFAQGMAPRVTDVEWNSTQYQAGKLDVTVTRKNPAPEDPKAVA